MNALASFLGDAITGAITALISLLLNGLSQRSSSGRQSHGTSRWAGWRDRRALGRLTRPRYAFGDGIVIGFFGSHLLQTPAEDNLLLLGVQRSGKTSSVVVPSLLSWSGAAVATSTKLSLICRKLACKRVRL